MFFLWRVAQSLLIRYLEELVSPSSLTVLYRVALIWCSPGLS